MPTQTLFDSLAELDIPSVHDLVARDLEDRKSVGILTYGRFLTQYSPEDMLQMAYEEALDMACYLKCEMEKRKQIPSEPDQSHTRNEVTSRTPGVNTWVNFMLHILIPDYLVCHGGYDSYFTMNQLKDYLNSHPELYPYEDTHKRMSTAITKLFRDGYFYHPSRYVWAATAKFVNLMQEYSK